MRHIRLRASLYRPRLFRSSRSRVLFALLATVSVVMAVALPAGAALAGQVGSLPSPRAVSDAALPQDTLIYDRTGQVLLGDLHPPGYFRYHVSLAQMGTWLPKATVDTEDASFWQGGGVDPAAILRAALTDLQQRQFAQGGSTITQQLVKLRVTGGSASLTRKIREAIIATQVSGTYSRSQILEMYLNTIFYGNNSYGVQAAARNYFHVDAAGLDLAQASMLAGIPRSPTAYDPFLHWDAAKDRQKQVLNAMVHARSITRTEADQAFAEDLQPHLFHSATTYLAPGFLDWVTQDLVQRFGQQAVTAGGLRVTTTLDWRLQQLAQQAVTSTVNANRWRDLSDGALTAVDPRTGQVLAMVGSAGPKVPGGQINLALWPPRNPGSTMKLFTYTAAIASKKYTMVTPIQDAPLTVHMQNGKPYQPPNDDGRYHGTCQLQQCLGNSLNVPAVQVEMVLGVPAVVQQARAMGAPPYVAQGSTYTNQVPAATFQPSLTLGGYPSTPLEMATGAAVLADQGVLHQPAGVLSVRGAGGGALAQANSSGKQVLDPGAAFIMSQMLSDDANRRMMFGSGTPLVLSGRHAAAKTGTTDSFTDGWTVGYTPSLATAVWMGNADSHPMARGTDGVTVAAPAWNSFMSGALNVLGTGDEWYDPPSNVYQDWVNGKGAWFLDGTSAQTPPPPLPSSVQLAAPRAPQVPQPGAVWNQLCGSIPWLCPTSPPGQGQGQGPPPQGPWQGLPPGWGNQG